MLGGLTFLETLPSAVMCCSDCALTAVECPQGSSLGGLAAGSNTIIEEEASEDLEADEEETDMR